MFADSDLNALRALRRELERELGFVPQIEATWIPSSPWIAVAVSPPPDAFLEAEAYDAVCRRYAIWRSTGNVYREHGGAVEDDPFITAATTAEPG
jgi:hypothetical protein